MNTNINSYNTIFGEHYNSIHNTLTTLLNNVMNMKKSGNKPNLYNMMIKCYEVFNLVLTKFIKGNSTIIVLSNTEFTNNIRNTIKNIINNDTNVLDKETINTIVTDMLRYLSYNIDKYNSSLPSVA